MNNAPNIRIEVTEGAQIPDPRDRRLLNAWTLAFCVAVVALVTLCATQPEPYLEIVKFLPDGLIITFEVTVLSLLCTLPIGLLTGLGRLSRNPVINLIASTYVEIIRGVPLLVQLFYIYYALGLAFRQLGQEEQARSFFRRASVGTGEPAGMMYYYDQPADMILYQGLAHRALGDEQAARARFHKLVDYGEAHLFDQVSFDYFAVSLPDLLLFQEDLTLRNRAHCEYLMALGSYGLGDTERAGKCYDAVLAIDCAHQGAILHKQLL